MPPMQARISLLLAMLVGQMVVVRVRAGDRFVGVVARATMDGDDGQLVLLSVQKLSDVDGQLVLTPQGDEPLTLQATDIVEMDASGAKISSAQDVDAANQAQQRRSSGFRTDTEISAAPGQRADGRALQRWDDEGSALALPADDVATTLEQSTKQGHWDQFAANEARFGVKSNYEETLYTTKLDRSGKDFKAREKEAERLAKEIMEGTTSNTHIAEERNQIPTQDENEEEKYGAVVRETPAAAPADATSTSATPGKALTADFRQFVSAERERLVVRKAELAQKEKQSRLADLKVWAQNFQLKTPVPADMATKKSPSSASAQAGGGVDEARAKLASMTIPAIPPFKKGDEKKKHGGGGGSSSSSGTSSSTTTKLNAKASAFNPGAASFTPGAKVVPSKPVVPSVPFFGTRELKNRPGTTQLRVSDNFRAPKSKKLGDANKVSVWWSYTGRPFRQQVAASAFGGGKMPFFGAEAGAMPMGMAPPPPPPIMSMPFAAPPPPPPPPGAPAPPPPGAAGPAGSVQGVPSPQPVPATAPSHIPRGGNGKSPRTPHQQPMMMTPPPPGPPGPPPPPGTPGGVAQQPYAFMYPMGQYRMPPQGPYMPPPMTPYAAPPMPAFPGAVPPGTPHGMGRPASPPKRASMPGGGGRGGKAGLHACPPRPADDGAKEGSA
ncbi:Polyadenylate-binding protein-interacting protein 3 [Malassezia pachydermatis]